MDPSRRALIVWGAMSFMGVLTAGRRAEAQRKLPLLIQSTLDLEHSINWRMVGPDWGRRRFAWTTAIHAAHTPAQVAAQVVQMSTAIGPHGLTPAWVSQRDAWVTTANAARTDAQVAHVLLALEAGIQWGATNSGWHVMRTTWAAALTAVR